MSVNPGVMRIGEVHSLLRKDYSDIELSKIRYYEDKGLVQPSRSRKGYRLYSERDVDCLREAIRLAQEEFVPLRVVRLRLIEQGLLIDGPAASAPRHAAREATVNVVQMNAPDRVPTPPALKVVAPPATEFESGERQYFPLAEFQRRTGLDAAMANQLQVLGLLTPVAINRQVSFTEWDVRVAAIVSLLTERGVELRLLGSLRRVAEREIACVDDLTNPLRVKGSSVSAEKANAVTAEVAAEVAVLRTVLYERALQEYLDA
jgi:DNA-binding transcriptional MerR regulator